MLRASAISMNTDADQLRDIFRGTEMCMTTEDFLSRRTRHLLLDAKAAIEAAPSVAKIMATEMNKDDKWIIGQINDFNKIAKHYIPSSNLIPPRARQTLN